ncbi:MAG: hypothetical protein ACR2QK_20910 [Acidimicrobiales bacterium]
MASPFGPLGLAAVAVSAMILTGCSGTGGDVPVDWSAQAESSLLAADVPPDVVDCALNVARKDLERGPLTELATDEALRHCRSARAVLDRSDSGAIADTELALTDVAWTRGDDPKLDARWLACEQGTGAACDELFNRSPVGSDYEDFGVSCGRRPDLLHCTELDQIDERDPSRP